MSPKDGAPVEGTGVGAPQLRRRSTRLRFPIDHGDGEGARRLEDRARAFLAGERRAATGRYLIRVALRVHGGLAARDCAAQARAAEEAGFTTVWFAENPFARGAMSALAASALATRTIRLGAGVFNPFNRQPTLIAMEMAALDELSDGRAVLGIGSGIRLAQIGIAPPRRVAAVRDAIHIVSGLLRGETVEYEGPVFSAHGVRLECDLRRSAVPIFMAAMGDRALELGGRIANGLMTPNLPPPAVTRRARGLVARGAAAAGKPMPAEVVQYVTCAIDDDPDEARRRAKAAVGQMRGT